MILPGSLFFWLLQCTLWLLGNTDNAHHIRGIPGIDYPNYETIPQTSFRCSEQLHIPGLYADPETGCQMFHHCYEHRHESFLCPPGTIFNQAILACDYWYSAECNEVTLHNRDDLPQKVISFDHETEFVPKKNPSLNVFDKMASLYEVKEPVPTNSKRYRSDVYTLEESERFSDGQILGIQTNRAENQKYTNSYLDIANLHDRREGDVLFESPDEYGSNQEENDNENSHRFFKDSFTDFESSGESGDLVENVFTSDDLLLLNNPEDHVDFEKQYFAYNESNHSENHTQHSNHVSNDEHMLTDSYTNLADKQDGSSKGDVESGDKFLRRQSENIENPNDRRKTKRRKPIFIIKSEEESAHITSEKSQDTSKVNSNDHVDYPNVSLLKESVTEFKPLITPAPSRTKRRKPILIDLEDLPQYDVNNGQNVPGGTRTSSINYEVNLKSEIPDFPIAAEEISVKLFPSKRKPVNGHLLDTTEKYNMDLERNIELKSLNNLVSLATDTYDTTNTLSTLKDDGFGDHSMNLNKVYPKRRKNIIHIIDSEDDHNVYTENTEPIGSAIYTTEFENEITTQSLNENLEVEPNINYHFDEKEHEIESDSAEVDTEQYDDSYNSISPYTHIEDDLNFYIENKDSMNAKVYTTELEDEITTQTLIENLEVFDKFSEANINYHNGEKEHEINSDYVEVDTEKYEDSSNFIPPYTRIEVSDGTDGTYFTEIDPEVAFNINKYEGESALEDEVNSINPKSFQDFEFSKHEKIPDFPYVTTEFPLSEMSTQMPQEIQYDEDATSQIYFIPNTVQTTLDNLGTTESVPNLFSKTSDKNHNVRESITNDLNNVDSINYKLLDNSNMKHTEYSQFDNDDLHNSIKQLPSYTYETNKDTNIQQKSEFEESNLNYEDKILNANTSQNITNVEEFDPILDAELQEYLSNENSNLENNFDFDLRKDIYTEPLVPLEDSSKYYLDGKYNSYHPVFDVDALEAHDSIQNEQELFYQTVEPKLEPDLNAYISDEPIKMDTLKKIKQENIENKDGEFDETSHFESSSDNGRTEIADELESDHATTLVNTLFETQNIPNHLQENSFNPKPDINNKATVKDASEIDKHNFIPSTEANMLNKEHFSLEQNYPGSIKTNNFNPKPNINSKNIPGSVKAVASFKTAKKEPARRHRAFLSPHQMEDMLFETFGSQNFANLPYSMLKLKQSGMRKFLPDSIHQYGLEDLAYSTRTGNLLQSPKISKLISFGKNLLRAKKAKLRILGKYVNSFQTNQ